MPIKKSYKRLHSHHLKTVSKELIESITNIVGQAAISLSTEDLQNYGSDYTEDYNFLPDVVVKPQNTEQVAAIARLCFDSDVALIPAGGRTGLSGAMLPIYGGVLLSTERMNKILNLDTRNVQITVEPGVITQHIDEAAQQFGFTYPVDPSSRGSCTIGGNIAHNSGGAHAVKYGLTKDYVLGLEAVLANGTVIRTGAKVLKNSTGYNLTQLLVGSEGTLAIVTEITLKLIPMPSHKAVLLAPFERASKACEAVSAIFCAGITPAALEFMERDALAFGQQYLGLNSYDLTGIEAHLLIEVDGFDTNEVQRQVDGCVEVLMQYGAGDILFADNPRQQDELWRIRRCLGEAVKGTTIYKEEDTVVPRAELPRLLAFVKELGAEYGFRSICYGHAGDGNLHINILRDQLPDEVWNGTLHEAIQKLFIFVVNELGGTLSGEHGVGFVQKPYLDIALSQPVIDIHHQLKKLFDPKGILNPGKIIDYIPS